MWVDLDNGYDAFAPDNSRTTLSDKPGQDAQLARALAMRLDFTAAESFDVVSRTTFGTSRSVYSFDGDWGNDESWGVNSPYDYFQRFDRERRTLSQDLRLVSRASVDDGADFRVARRHLRAAHRRRRRATSTSGVTCCLATAKRAMASDYRATNLAATASSNGGSARRRSSLRACAVKSRSADYADTNGAAFSPDETMFGGSLSVRHALGERSTAYARLARGYKAGGFNIGAQVPEQFRTFETETLNSLELGLRAANADATVATDVALFYMRRNDQQVPTGEQLVPGDPLSFVLYTDNAARGENFGLEATLQLAARAAMAARPARRAARNALHRLRIRRPRPRRARAGARAAVPVRRGRGIPRSAWLVWPRRFRRPRRFLLRRVAR